MSTGWQAWSWSKFFLKWWWNTFLRVQDIYDSWQPQNSKLLQDFRSLNTVFVYLLRLSTSKPRRQLSCAHGDCALSWYLLPLSNTSPQLLLPLFCQHPQHRSPGTLASALKKKIIISDIPWYTPSHLVLCCSSDGPLPCCFSLSYPTTYQSRYQVPCYFIYKAAAELLFWGFPAIVWQHKMSSSQA